MAAKSYSVHALVVGKTKLGETDIIVTLMAEDGSCIRAVAKGARKPGSSFASRLELGCVIDALVAHGRSLDIVQEVRLVEAHAPLRSDPNLLLCAQPLLELISKTMQEGLEAPRLFSLVDAALGSIDESTTIQALGITAAALLKSMAFLGFKPSLDTCVYCGSQLQLRETTDAVALSIIDGGAVCNDCKNNLDVMMVDAPIVAWAHALLYSTFYDVRTFEIPESLLFNLLQFDGQWIAVHAGVRLKSLDYLMTSGVLDLG